MEKIPAPPQVCPYGACTTASLHHGSLEVMPSNKSNFGLHQTIASNGIHMWLTDALGTNRINFPTPTPGSPTASHAWHLTGRAIGEQFSLLNLGESAWGSGSGDTLRMSLVFLSTTQP